MLQQLKLPNYKQNLCAKSESLLKNNSSGKTAKKEKFPKNLSSKNKFQLWKFFSSNRTSKLRTLHVQGFTGTGVSIAVIDTGFPTVNTGSAFC